MNEGKPQPGQSGRVCYYMQTHKEPAQIARLVKVIKEGSPSSIVLVDHDASAAPLDPHIFEDIPDVHVIYSVGGYGDFSHLYRYFGAVDWLDDHGVDFSWLQSLSGQDYPLRAIGDTEQLLAAGDFDGYLQYAPVFPERTPPDADWGAGPEYRLCNAHDAPSRFNYKFRRFGRLSPDGQRLLRPFMIVNWLQPWLRVSLAYSCAGFRRKSTIFSDDFICYGGSFFCALSASCARYARDFARENSDIVDYCSTVGGPEEMFLQTVLVNSGKFRLAHQGTHYSDFTNSRYGHARVLETADLAAMLASGAHWARKFDRDSEVLDILDRRHGGLGDESGMTNDLSEIHGLV